MVGWAGTNLSIKWKGKYNGSSFSSNKKGENSLSQKLETYVGNRLTFKAHIVRLNFDVSSLVYFHSGELIQFKISHKYTTSN